MDYEIQPDNREYPIYVKRYPPGTLFPLSPEKDPLFPVSRREIWRYAGMKNGSPGREDERGRMSGADNHSGMEEETALEQLLEEVIREAGPLLEAQVCYRVLPLDDRTREEVLPFLGKSENLTRLLAGCRGAVLFAATIGMKYDILLRKVQRVSPAKGLLLQAFGTERVEALCDGFCTEFGREAKGQEAELTARFSPGYGDLPLQVQADFFRLLDCSRQIGVSLTRQLLMTPEKSVTAIFGIRKGSKRQASDSGQSKAFHPYGKCISCRKKDCLFREEGRQSPDP